MLFEALQAFSFGKAGEEFVDAPGLAGKDKVGCNFAERFEDECPEVRTRVRQDQRRGIAHFGAEREKVEIQRPRFIVNPLRLPVKEPLEVLEFGKKAFRSFLPPRLESRRRVDEQG